MKIGVAIIESLDDNERKTGKELSESTLKYISFQKEFLENEYFDVSTKNEFLDTLSNLYQKAVSEKKFYFLHFEIHGNKDGMVLKNNDFISWATILPYLRNLNIFYQNNLSVYFAVCKGNNILRFINHLERAPFALMIGSFQDVYNIDIVNIFEEFYSKFFEKFSTLDAFLAIQKLSTRSEFTVITSVNIIEILLKLESENNDKAILLKEIDEHLIELCQISDNIKIIVENFRNEVVQIFKEYKVDKDFFLMSDLK